MIGRLLQRPKARSTSLNHLAGNRQVQADEAVAAAVVLSEEVRGELRERSEQIRVAPCSWKPGSTAALKLAWSPPWAQWLGIIPAVGVDLACLLFGAAAWQCALRPVDRLVGSAAGGGLAVHRQQLPFFNFALGECASFGQPHSFCNRPAHCCRLASALPPSALPAGDLRATGPFPGHLLPGGGNWTRVGQTTGRTRQNERQRDNLVHAPCKDIYL